MRKAINAPIGAQRVKYVTHNVTNIYSKDPDQVPAVGKIVNGSSSVVESNFDVDGLNTDADLVSETKDAVSPSLIRKRVVTPQQKIHSNHLLDETQNGQSQESKQQPLATTNAANHSQDWNDHISVAEDDKDLEASEKDALSCSQSNDQNDSQNIFGRIVDESVHEQR